MGRHNEGTGSHSYLRVVTMQNVNSHCQYTTEHRKKCLCFSESGQLGAISPNGPCQPVSQDGHWEGSRSSPMQCDRGIPGSRTRQYILQCTGAHSEEDL